VNSTQNRVGVGCYVDPITPLWATWGNIRLARLLGAEDIWLGDHAKSMFPSSAWNSRLSPMARFIPSLDAFLDPTVVIARGTGRFGTVMGTSVTDTVRRSPADLARVWMSLHHLSRGRAILGIGSGESENTHPFGLSPDPRVARLEETVVAIRAAWASAGDPLTHAGRFHDWNHATFALPTLRGTVPPIWIGAQGPKVCRVAGRHGDGWIFILNAGLEAWRSAADQVIDGARESGRDPDTLKRSIYFAPLLARNPHAAEELARQPMVHAMLLTLPASAWAAVGADHPLGSDYAGFSELDPEMLQADRLTEYGKLIPSEVVRALIPFGTAEQVVEKLRTFVEAGVNHVIIYSAAASMKPSLAAGSVYEQRRLITMLKRLRPGRFGT
jgi:phthiodiolone/phenolphthiodiolone dimycocerosates ketoreductase